MGKIEKELLEKKNAYEKKRLSALRGVALTESMSAEGTTQMRSAGTTSDALIQQLDKALSRLKTRALSSGQPSEMAACLAEYRKLLPETHWPSVFVKTTSDAQFQDTVAGIRQMGFPLAKSRYKPNESPESAYRLFGLVHLHLPPDMDFVSPIAGIQTVAGVFDAERLFHLPKPEAPTEIDIFLDRNRDIIEYPDGTFPLWGENATICIIDTGIDRHHPDLTGRVIDAVDFSDDGNEEDLNGHGTHCAGIAAGDGTASGGQYKGIAPHANLLSAKVLNRNGSGSITAILNGIRWAMESGADVLSMSLGGIGMTNGRSLLSLACDQAANRGLIVCVAAGNSGPGNGTIGIPGDARMAVTVGAIDKNCQLAFFSSRGPTDDPEWTGFKPNILAPGVNIIAARASKANFPPFSENKHYASLSGTSMACPQISGCAALAVSYARHLGRNPLSPEIFANIIKETAIGLENYSPDEQGDGLVRLSALLENIGTYLGTPQKPVEEKPGIKRYCAVDRVLITPSMTAHICPSCGTALICSFCHGNGHILCPDCNAKTAPPEGSLMTEHFHYLETSYLDRAAQKLAAMNGTMVTNLLTGKSYRVDRWEKIRQHGSQIEIIQQKALDHQFKTGHRIDLTTLERCFPQNAWYRYDIGSRNFWGKLKEKVIVITGVLSPVDDLIQKGFSKRQLTPADITEFLATRGINEKNPKDSTVFYYAGLYSPTGWEESCKELILTGPNYRLFLIEKNEAGHWVTHGHAEPQSDRVKELFDPVTIEEKIQMVKDYIEGNGHLAYSGKFMLADIICDALNFSTKSVENIFRDLSERHPHFSCEEIAGKILLKRV